MPYVDGFVIPVPKKHLGTYRSIARKAAKVWRDYGALEVLECSGDDLATKFGKSFPKLVKLKRGETVVFSWIRFKSRADRDRVNAKVMQDPRMNRMMKNVKMPFEIKRMTYGGFKVMVNG